MSRGAVFAVLVLCGFAGPVLSGGEAVRDEALVVAGKMLYQQMCRHCHGHELRSSGTSTFDLRTFPAGDRQRFHASVMHGSGDMPPHDDILLDGDVDALFAYVLAVQRREGK